MRVTFSSYLVSSLWKQYNLVQTAADLKKKKNISAAVSELYLFGSLLVFHYRTNKAGTAITLQDFICVSCLNFIHLWAEWCGTWSYFRDIFVLVINQPDAQNLFCNKFISCLYMFRAPCAHRQEVKIVLYSLWYYHTILPSWRRAHGARNM